MKVSGLLNFSPRLARPVPGFEDRFSSRLFVEILAERRRKACITQPRLFPQSSGTGTFQPAKPLVRQRLQRRIEKLRDVLKRVLASVRIGNFL